MSEQVFAWMFQGGKLTRLYTAGAAVDVDLDIRPAAGKMWLILMGFVWHDDPAARDITFYLSDGTTESLFATDPAAAQNVSTGLGYVSTGGSTHMHGVILDRDNYLVVKVAALAAGKKLYFDGLVMEIDAP